MTPANSFICAMLLSVGVANSILNFFLLYLFLDNFFLFRFWFSGHMMLECHFNGFLFLSMRLIMCLHMHVGAGAFFFSMRSNNTSFKLFSRLSGFLQYGHA